MGINNNTSKMEISTPVVNGWDLHGSFLPWRLKAFIYHNYPLPLTHRLLYCTLFHTQTFTPIDVSATQKIIKPLEIVTSDLDKWKS